MPRARRHLLRPTLAALSLSLWLGVCTRPNPLFSADWLSHRPVPQPHAGRDAGRDHHRYPILQNLLEQDPRPVLIDVYRRQWLQGPLHRRPTPENLPGSHWLANTGDGELTPQWQAYFADAT